MHHVHQNHYHFSFFSLADIIIPKNKNDLTNTGTPHLRTVTKLLYTVQNVHTGTPHQADKYKLTILTSTEYDLECLNSLSLGTESMVLTHKWNKLIIFPCLYNLLRVQ